LNSFDIPDNFASVPDYLAGSSEIAMQADLLNPAMNSAQKSKRDANGLKNAVDGLMDLFGGSKTAQSTFNLGSKAKSFNTESIPKIKPLTF
jgi:hypothetical protein